MADKNYQLKFTLSDGQELDAGTFTVPQGEKGQPGAAGHTPVKGVDYWTEADKEEIKAEAQQMTSGARIAMGSYEGTGEYGVDAPNSLTFDFAPKILILYQNSYSPSNDNGWGGDFQMLMKNAWFLHVYVRRNGGEYLQQTPVFDGNTVFWYIVEEEGLGSYTESEKVNAQMNTWGYTYHYIAIG